MIFTHYLRWLWIGLWFTLYPVSPSSPAPLETRQWFSVRQDYETTTRREVTHFTSACVAGNLVPRAFPSKKNWRSRHLDTQGTRGFSRVRWEFSVLAEGRHIFGRRPKPRVAIKTWQKPETALEKSLAPRVALGSSGRKKERTRERETRARARVKWPHKSDPTTHLIWQAAGGDLSHDLWEDSLFRGKYKIRSN